MDLEAGFGQVWLPHALARKYPNAPKEWGWQYVFPAAYRSKDPRSERVGRHHFGESTVQKAVRGAVIRAGVKGPINCHTFRHHADCRIMPMVSSACVLLVTGSNASGVCERGMIGVSSPKPTLAK
ncbi:MAG TPA: integron integrase, partial [Thermoanaerobaculia bacterium]|nr:integron integrase [Thermoanaerobaculia bacterium]